jgi:hypothetical protein|nr:MAG TPA: hypothetical protein [Caudoviricetes sp.]
MIWILFIVAIIILSIIVMMKGWNKLHCSMFYEGLIMATPECRDLSEFY